VIGAQKGGTSSLYAALAGHPEVVPAMRKEVHFFDRRRRSLLPYRANFPVFDAGPALIDIANKDELRDVLSADKDARLYGWQTRDAAAAPSTVPAPAAEPAER